MFAVASFKLSKDPKAFYYLNQSGLWTDPTINDKADWDRIDVCIIWHMH